jgi:hypothetical protein
LSQLPCGNIDPYGITSTPVLDMSSGGGAVLRHLRQLRGPSRGRQRVRYQRRIVGQLHIGEYHQGRHLDSRVGRSERGRVRRHRQQRRRRFHT